MSPYHSGGELPLTSGQCGLLRPIPCLADHFVQPHRCANDTRLPEEVFMSCISHTEWQVKLGPHFLFLFFLWYWGLNSGLARQELYHLSHAYCFLLFL
jgi:hypothetical protein